MFNITQCSSWTPHPPALQFQGLAAKDSKNLTLVGIWLFPSPSSKMCKIRGSLHPLLLKYVAATPALTLYYTTDTNLPGLG